MAAFEKILLRDAILDESRLERAKAEAAKADLSLLEVIPQLGFAKDEDLYRALAEFCEMRYVVPSKMEIPESVIAKVPARFATHYRFVPVEERNGTLVVAVSDPLNSHLLDDIRLVLKQRIEAVVATPEEVNAPSRIYYGVGADTDRAHARHNAEGPKRVRPNPAPETPTSATTTIDASIIKFVNELILEAVKSGTTDIHIEPYEEQLRVRFRIDGILHQVPAPPTHPRLSRGHRVAREDHGEPEHRREAPAAGRQDPGEFGRTSFDLRVSILPTPHGETVNIRVLTRSSMFLTLENWASASEDLAVQPALSTSPTASCWSPGPRAAARPRRSTPRWAS
jgi:type IV pilus assembly protein PilB